MGEVNLTPIGYTGKAIPPVCSLAATTPVRKLPRKSGL